MLVIRAIDDEASLVMALGTIVNYATTKSIVIASFIFSLWFLLAIFKTEKSSLPDVALIVAGWIVFTILLFGILMVSRSVHGRELAVSPMECQINTQSTPDGAGTKIITLVRRTYVKSLRHGIYDHEDCAKTISDWVRFRLETN